MALVHAARAVQRPAAALRAGALAASRGLSPHVGMRAVATTGGAAPLGLARPVLGSDRWATGIPSGIAAAEAGHWPAAGPMRCFVTAPPSAAAGGGGGGGGAGGAGAAGAGAAAPPAGVAGEADEVIFEIDSSSFTRLVMESPVPVVLDCYADWCGPCKQLTPVLEAAVRAMGGAVRLCKLNTDNNPDLAQGLNVRSLPTVIGIHRGRMVDSFVGMQQQARLEQFFGTVMAAGGGAAGGPENHLGALDTAAMALEDKDTAMAASIYSKVAALPDSKDDATVPELRARASAGLLRCALAEGDDAAAESLAKALRGGNFRSLPDVVRALAAYDLALSTGGEGEGEGGLEARQAAVDADPADLQARFDLAKALVGAGRHEEAVAQLFAILRKDRKWGEPEGEARKTVIRIFEALGAEHPVTIKGRRTLASIILV